MEIRTTEYIRNRNHVKIVVQMLKKNPNLNSAKEHERLNSERWVKVDDLEAILIGKELTYLMNLSQDT